MNTSTIEKKWFFFFSSRRRHTRSKRDWSSDVCSSDLNEKLLSEARAERQRMLREARDTKNAIINEAKGKATTEANRLLQMAREAINNEKQASITELKNQVATLSIEIAEKILREQLKDTAKQKELAEKYLKEVKMN